MNIRPLNHATVLLGALTLLAMSCTADDDGGTGTVVGGSGGNAAAGGSPGTTGGSKIGGSAGTGGSTGSGGSAGSAVAGKGGQGVGGAGNQGGSSGAPPTGGSSTTGGAAGATSSPGCTANTPEACSTSGSPCTINVEGTEREYYVVLPADYTPSRPYPVVFQFHPLGGNAEQGMNMYRIRENFPEAIYVTPQGLGSQPGWANTNGEDVAFVRAMMAELEKKYCVDATRYFSTGFSYGGIMSFTISCQMADEFRAIAPMAGFQFGMEASCSPSRPIAAWIANGSADTLVDPDGAATLRDIIREKNGCQSTSQPVDPSPCVTYAGCQSGYPVVWCLNEGQGHAIPSYGSTAIAKFFMQF